MSLIYIVQGLGIGDNPEEFETICAFTLRSDAERWIADAKTQDAMDYEDSYEDADFDYRIIAVGYNQSHAEFYA